MHIGHHAGIVETFEHCIRAAIHRPAWDQRRGKPGGGRIVWILIDPHFDAFGPGHFDAMDHRLRITPNARTQSLDVSDDASNIGFAGHMDDLLDGRDKPDGVIAFVPDVAGIEAAIFAGDFRQFHNFGNVGERTGRVKQPARQPEGALLHPRPDQFAHIFDLRLIGVGIHIAHHGSTHRIVRHHLADIEPDAVRKEIIALRGQIDRPAAIGIDENGREPLGEQRLAMR